jgi:hypothetical protein
MLTNIAEKLGILDVVAPWIDGGDGSNQTSQSQQKKKPNPTSNDDIASKGISTTPTNSTHNPLQHEDFTRYGKRKRRTIPAKNAHCQESSHNNSIVREDGNSMGNLEAKESEKEKRRISMLTAQKEEEDRSRKIGQFAKKQRVSYHHRGTNKQYDAVIVGVHLDDGPDKPYYVSEQTLFYFGERRHFTNFVLCFVPTAESLFLIILRSLFQRLHYTCECVSDNQLQADRTFCR